ncbi:TolC family protein [Tannerella sp.]|uniref:TolC family protein n=1 Tax=Tannerella sp. TaxID=2382127 RepID=UPI0026DD4F0B|nr:TolC family protein [Tannerella sp.]
MRYLFLSLLFGGFGLPAEAQSSFPQECLDTLRIRLDQAIEIALSENPTVKVAGQEIEKKQYARKEMIAQLFPQVSGSAGYTRTLKKQVMYMGGGDDDGGGFAAMLMEPIVGLTKPLYDKLGLEMPQLPKGGGRRSNEGIEVGLSNNWSGGFSLALPVFAPTLYKSIQLSAIDVELAAEKARASRQDMVNQVSKAYFQLLLAQDSYEVLKQSYKQAQDNLENVTNKFRQGFVSEYDKIRAEVQVRNLNPGLIQARNAVTSTNLQLKVLMGVDAECQIAVLGKLSDYEVDLYGDYMHIDTAQLAGNTSLRQMDLQTRMLKKTYEMDKAAFLPNVSLSAIYQWTAMNEDFRFRDYRWNPYSTVGVTVSVPLFTGGRRLYKMKQTKIQLNQMNWNRTNLRRNLNMQARSYLNNMQQSVEQLASNKENVNQAMKGRSIAQKRYDVGKGTILELNDSELALTQSKLTYTQSIYNYLVAKTDLDLILGKEAEIK